MMTPFASSGAYHANLISNSTILSFRMIVSELTRYEYRSYKLQGLGFAFKPVCWSVNSQRVVNLARCIGSCSQAAAAVQLASLSGVITWTHVQGHLCRDTE